MLHVFAESVCIVGHILFLSKWFMQGITHGHNHKVDLLINIKRTKLNIKTFFKYTFEP